MEIGEIIYLEELGHRGPGSGSVPEFHNYTAYRFIYYSRHNNIVFIGS